jgi:hypothetical protein
MELMFKSTVKITILDLLNAFYGSWQKAFMKVYHLIIAVYL